MQQQYDSTCLSRADFVQYIESIHLWVIIQREVLRSTVNIKRQNSLLIV